MHVRVPQKCSLHTKHEPHQDTQARDKEEEYDTQEVASCRVEVHLKVLKLIFGDLTPNEICLGSRFVSIYLVCGVELVENS